jgi:hypothetical protein
MDIDRNTLFQQGAQSAHAMPGIHRGPACNKIVTMSMIKLIYYYYIKILSIYIYMHIKSKV